MLRRSVIFGGVGTLVPLSTSGKNISSLQITGNTNTLVDTITRETLRPEYLPNATRLRKLGTEMVDPVVIELKESKGDITSLFASARGYFESGYYGSAGEERKKILEKKYPGYEIIPYIVARADIADDIKNKNTVHLIYMARRKNTKPKNSSDWLLEWVGPIESSLDVGIMGTAPKAKTYEDAAVMKSLGAGTNFQILYTQDSNQNPNEYIVLATRYPQYGRKEPIIQSPFSEGLASESIMKQGKRYFEELQTRVTRLLATASWSEGLKDIEWYKIIQGLILTENMNPAPFGISEKEEIVHYERELRKVYAILGANNVFAFRRMSSMGAKGIVQFTEGAWEGRGEAWDAKNKKGKRTGIRHNFLLPGFTSNPDFHTVIGDHTLSVLAACAHVMSQYQEYKESKIASVFHSISDAVKQVVLAAGYNSNNTDRIKNFSDAHQNGEGGHDAVLGRFYRNLTNKGADETRGYMRKFLFALKSLGYSVPENSFFRLHGYNPKG